MNTFNIMICIATTTLIAAPPDRCFDLARSVEVHVAGNIHSGESAVARPGVTAGLLKLGDSVTWRAKHLGIWQHLTSEITAYDRPRYFHDKMTKGPFRAMAHDHFFEATGSGQTSMKDIFRVEAPLAILGRIAEFVFLRNYMRALLEERNAVLKRIAESEEWRKYL